MSSPAPKRRLDVKSTSRGRADRTDGDQQTTANRRAPRRRARRSTRPSMATVGALALIAAGLGTAAISGRTDSGPITSEYQTLSADTAETGYDVSRDFDREALQAQTDAQGEQILQAQADLQVATQAKADELKANQWVLPVTGYHITGRYGTTNSLWGKGHSGLDFAAPSGTTIVALAAGEVTAVRYSGNCGNMTMIRLDEGDLDIMYCHQSSQTVEVGQHVLPGDVVGYVGSTGRSTGPHLHVEVKPGGGHSVDPEPVFHEHNVFP